MAHLSFSSTDFNHLLIEDVDPTTLSFEGGTEDYAFNDHRSLNHLSFCTTHDDSITIDKVIEEIRNSFRYKTVQDVNQYVKRVEALDHETDKRTKIVIKFHSGKRGLFNDARFSFK